MRSRSCGLVAAIVLATSASAATAVAHDSLAPPGAPHQWLPAESWAFRHWIPFDEETLKNALGLRGRDLEAYLYNDHHTLADLARSRGIDVEQLADELVAPWRAIVDEGQVAVFRDRTTRLLTQGHLAQHVFFHVFHGIGAETSAPWLFGVSRAEFKALRLTGQSPLDVALRYGVSKAAVTNGMLQLFRREHDEGVRSQQAWQQESGRILARQAARLPCWMHRPHPPRDPTNPYGKAMLQHGAHSAGWPFTPLDQLADELRVQRVRRSLKRSCWRRPSPWSWSARALNPPQRAARPVAASWRSRPRARGGTASDLHCRL